VDIIPQMLVSRVDVVTGGVSAVYGSDAVSGVVNYILDKKFNGVRAEGSYGLTQYGDGTKLDLGAAWGHSLGDRGHVEVSYEFRKEGGIDRRTDRAWLNQVGVTGTGTTANPFVLQTGLRQSAFPFGGKITGTAGTLNNQVFKSDGALSPYVAGTATGTTGVELGGDGGYWDSGLVSKLKGHQVFGRFDYELTDALRFYAQVSGNLKTNSNVAETNQLNGVNISKTNAFLSPTYQALIPEATFKISEFLANAPRVSADVDSRQWTYNAGLEGDIGSFAWGVDYVHGISKLATVMHNVINRQSMGYALDAVYQTGTSGNIVCNVTKTNPGLADGCVAFNPFGPTAASAAAIDYVTDDVHFNSR
jgi:iron complex outermembrane receptor protein